MPNNHTEYQKKKKKQEKKPFESGCRGLIMEKRTNRTRNSLIFFSGFKIWHCTGKITGVEWIMLESMILSSKRNFSDTDKNLNKCEKLGGVNAKENNRNIS